MRESFTPEKIKFLKDNALKYDAKVLASLYNKKFNANLSVDAIRLCMQRRNILYIKHVMKYTQEMINYLKNNSLKYGIKDLTNLFNKKFNANATAKKITLTLIYHRIDYIKKCTPLRHTPEMIDFLRANALIYYTRDIAVLFNKRFNTALTANDIRSVLYHHSIPFIKNNTRYPNSFAHPIGQEIVKRKNNTTYVKVSNTGKINERWVKKQNVIWEQAHGKIPKGHCVIFLDGNKSNFELDNLELVKITEYRLFIKYGLNYDNKELTRASLAVFKHKTKILEIMTEGMNRDERRKAKTRLYSRVYGKRRRNKEKLQNAH